MIQILSNIVKVQALPTYASRHEPSSNTGKLVQNGGGKNLYKRILQEPPKKLYSEAYASNNPLRKNTQVKEQASSYAT